jgi:large conductance mechanosensitive channel
MIDEFKKFILRGNVIDLATGVIIGAAFTGIVSAFTAGIVSPILAAIGGGPAVGLKIWIFDLGIILTAVINFLITAAVIFFVIIKPANLLLARMKSKDAAPPPAGPTDEVKLLTEIRDALRK